MNEADRERYSRQIVLAAIGEQGQSMLAESHALIIGCGALGSSAAERLCRAGVGRLTLVDRDVVELSNLPRQSLFTESDAKNGLPKSVALAAHLKEINSRCKVDSFVEHLDSTRIERFIGQADCVLDGSDNFEIRYIINDACIKLNKPWVYAGVSGTKGVSMAVLPGRGPCLRCLFETAPPPEQMELCDVVGVLSTAVATVSAFQCTEAIKILLGRNDDIGRLFDFDIWAGSFRSMDVTEAEREDCICCGERRFEHLDMKRQTVAASFCGSRDVQVLPVLQGKRNLDEFAQRLDEGKIKVRSEYYLRFIADGTEISLFPDGRAIIHDIEDEKRALAFYARHIGH